MAIGWFFVLGLSHLIHRRAWSNFVIMLRSWGEPGAFICGLVCLWVGAWIVSVHPVWRGIPMMLTLFGWVQIAKALWYFTMPRASLRHMEQVTEDNTWLFLVPGIIFLAIGALLGYDLIAHGI